jgi:hypothetical protein
MIRMPQAGAKVVGTMMAVVEGTIVVMGMMIILMGMVAVKARFPPMMEGILLRAQILWVMTIKVRCYGGKTIALAI